MEPVNEVVKPTPETGQLADTKRVLIEALSESDDVYKFPENGLLKHSWIDGAKASLEKPSPEGQDTIRIESGAQANLAWQPNRGFVAAYLNHLGTALKLEHIKDYASGRHSLVKVSEDQVANPRDEKPFGLPVKMAEINILQLQLRSKAFKSLYT